MLRFILRFLRRMAEFDAQVGAEDALREQINQLQFENQRLNQNAQQNHINAQHYMGQQNQNFQNQFLYHPQPHLAPRPNLNLPPPPHYDGNPTTLQTWKLKLIQFLRGNATTYFDDISMVMYASSLMSGPAQQWLETIMDPVSATLPPHYTLDLFLHEITAFFGGVATIALQENDLDDLQHTGTVRQFAVEFQTIISKFRPAWTDSAAIYVFSRKLKPQIRFEVARKGEVPTGFQAYMGACIHMEACIAAGKPRHFPSPHPSQPQPQQPPRQLNPNPSRQALPVRTTPYSH